MEKMDFINEMLLKINADFRITDGIFKIKDPQHLLVLREYLEKEGVDNHVIDKYITDVVDESKTSEAARKKGWKYKGGYWWKGDTAVARSVDGKLKTLAQIEQDKLKDQRDAELERERRTADRQYKEKEERRQRHSKEDTNRLVKGLGKLEREPEPQLVKIEPVVSAERPKETEYQKALRVKGDIDREKSSMSFKTKKTKHITVEGIEIEIVSLLNENDELFGFLNENDEYVKPLSENDPRYNLTDEELTEHWGWINESSTDGNVK